MQKVTKETSSNTSVDILMQRLIISRCIRMSTEVIELVVTTNTSVDILMQRLIISRCIRMSTEVIELVSFITFCIFRLYWLMGHCGLLGSELPNHWAKLAAVVKDEAHCPLTLGKAVTAVKHLMMDQPFTHDRTRSVHDKVQRTDRAEILRRKHVILLTELCYGHNNLFHAYCHITDPATHALGPKCGEVKHVVEHLFTFSGFIINPHGTLRICWCILKLISLQVAKSVVLAKKSL